MHDVTIVFIHGYTASHLADWYPTISPKLDALGIPYVIPDLPGNEHPHASEWLATLHTAISTIRTPIVLVGHSLGSRAALLYLEKYRPNVKTVLLIAAFNNNTANGKRNEGKSYPDFFDHTIDLTTLTPLVGEFVVMHSKDDDSIPYAQGVEIAKDLHADLVTYEDRSHFSAPENAPYILKELRKKVRA